MSSSLSDLEIISVLKTQTRGLSTRRLSQILQTHYTLSYTPTLSVSDLRRLIDLYPELVEKQKGVFFWDETQNRSNQSVSNELASNEPVVNELSDQQYETGKALLRSSVKKKHRFAPYLPPASLSQARLSHFLSPYPASPTSILEIENARV